MKKQIITALKFLALMTILTGIAYPGLVTLITSVFFHQKALGSLVERDGVIIGSGLIGQDFHRDLYFWSRPSAIDYNPLPSGASNLGLMSPLLREKINERDSIFRQSNNIKRNSGIPSEMITASASGLDPHISPESALQQVDRVARARGMDEVKKDQIVKLIYNMTEIRQFSFLGEPRINVFLLNLRVDSIK